MTPAEAMNTIKVRRFADLANLASNLKTFLRSAAQQPEVEALSRAMMYEPEVASEVWQRALALSAARAEGDRESEGDAALAAYLWLLGNHQRDLAQAVARGLREGQHFFWARKVADDLRLTDGSGDGKGREARPERTGAPTEDLEALHRKP